MIIMFISCHKLNLKQKETEGNHNLLNEELTPWLSDSRLAMHEHKAEEAIAFRQ